MGLGLGLEVGRGGASAGELALFVSFAATIWEVVVSRMRYLSSVVGEGGEGRGHDYCRDKVRNGQSEVQVIALLGY